MLLLLQEWIPYLGSYLPMKGPVQFLLVFPSLFSLSLSSLISSILDFLDQEARDCDILLEENKINKDNTIKIINIMLKAVMKII
jgi:hypothetical protein